MSLSAEASGGVEDSACGTPLAMAVVADEQEKPIWLTRGFWGDEIVIGLDTVLAVKKELVGMKEGEKERWVMITTLSRMCNHFRLCFVFSCHLHYHFLRNERS